MPKKTPWTDEIVAEFKNLHAQALPFGVIGEKLTDQFRVYISRSACIGKARRLGLEKRKPERPKEVKQRRPHRTYKFESPSIMPRPPDPVPPPKIGDMDIPLSQRKSLLQLQNHHCRWPVGEVGSPDFFFCGSSTADLRKGRPYCAAHHRIASNGTRYVARPWFPRKVA
jgi:GcrA cell cycle regulator